MLPAGVSGSLNANLETVRQTLARSAERAARDPGAISLVAVTKTLPVARIREAMALGLKTFGENRVQEALPKIEAVGTGDGTLALNRPLPTNKGKSLEGRFATVPSVHREEQVRALDPR